MFTLDYQPVPGTPNSEQSLAQWNMGLPVLEITSQGEDTLTVPVLKTGASSGLFTPPIPWAGWVVVRRNRTWSGSAWTGGSIIFQGYHTTPSLRADPRAPRLEMVFSGPWWQLARTIYQQAWTYSTNGTITTGNYSPRVLLFQNYDLSSWTPGTTPPAATHLTNGQQITAIVGYAAGCGAEIQMGYSDLYYTFQTYQVKGISCATALQYCLKATPDAVFWFDYTQTPPALNCSARSSPVNFAGLAGYGGFHMTQVTLPYADGISHASSDITPRYDLQTPSVVIQYLTTTSANGVQVNASSWDVYPIYSTSGSPPAGAITLPSSMPTPTYDGSGNIKLPYQWYNKAAATFFFIGAGALIVPLDLRGGATNFLTGSVASEVIAPSAAAYWQWKKKDLVALCADGVTSMYSSLAVVSGSVLVKDDAGNDWTSAVTAGTLMEQISGAGAGEVLPWMQLSGGAAVSCIMATVQAALTYTLKDPKGRVVKQVNATNPHIVTVRVKLTNSPAGTQNYSVVSAINPSESPILGLAQYLYQSLQPLHWQGTHTVLKQNPDTMPIYNSGMMLNLSGGNAAWLASVPMNAVIQHARHDFFHGRTTVSFGPPKHLAPGDLEELLQMWRLRQPFENPVSQASGVQGGLSGATQVTGGSVAENTSHQTENPALHTVANDLTASGDGTTWIQHDPRAAAGAPVAGIEGISLQRVSSAGVQVAPGTVDSSGARVGALALKMADMEGAALRIGRVHYTDAGSGLPKVAWMPRSAAVSDPPSYGTNGSDDLYIGGSGGGASAPTLALELSLKIVRSDYVVGWPTTALAITQLTDVLATCTTAVAHGIAVGASTTVVISGATPIGYNGTFTAIATSTTAFTYALPAALASATGTILANVFGSNLSVSTLTSAAGTTITATCAAAHGLAMNQAGTIGATLNGTISGASPSTYNGTFTNLKAINTTQFRYMVGSTPASTPATGAITYQADIWVAKDYQLRCSKAGETEADGTVVTFYYSGATDPASFVVPSAPSGDGTAVSGDALSGNCCLEKYPTTGPGGTGSPIVSPTVFSVAPEWHVSDILYAAPAATTLQVNQSGVIYVLSLVIGGHSRNWTAIGS